MKGIFLALEGGDGAGKTGAMKTIERVMEEMGHDVTMTREPGGTPGGKAIRQLVVDPEAPYDQITNTMLYAADRHEHVEKVIRPALEQGRCVISDRYVLSTLAYQGAGQGVDRDFILELHRRTTDDLWPDLTIVMDVNPRVALERAAKRDEENGSKEGRFEAFAMDFHDRMYECMTAYDLTRCRRVNADQEPELVLSEIESLLKEEVPQLI